MNSARNVLSPDIVLVQPPNPVLSDPTTRWPLGLGYLEAVLVKAGYKVALADLRAEKQVDISLIPEAPIVGITATTGEISMAKQLARELRKRDSKVKVAIGGAHATHMPIDCWPSFDYVVIGEGENEILGILGGEATYDLKDLDSLPFPARHPFSFSETLFEGAGYGKAPKATSIITSRGCPMQCSYCRVKPDRVRFRSPENVAEEIDQLITDWDCRYFRFEDDNITLNKERALRLFELLEPLHINWRAHTRSNLWDNELAKLAKRAGCSEIGFGFEVATDSILKFIRKGETVAQNREAVKVCKRNGIRCKAFWMTSMPGETWETIEDIKRFMIEEKPDKWIVSRLCPYPGSDMWESPQKYGIISIDSNFNHYWNFAELPLVAYEGIKQTELDDHYHHLVSWLSKEFPR